MLQDKALLVSLSLSMFSGSKTDKRLTRRVLREHSAAQGSLRVAKRMLPEEALEPIKKLHGEIREHHYNHTVPWGENERLLASSYYMEYADWMRARRSDLDRAVASFLQNYPIFIDEARRQLNGAFNAEDYPGPDAVRNRFGFRLEYKPVPEAGDFRISLMHEEMEALRAQLAARIEEAERAARSDVARRIAEPLAAMVNRLSDPDSKFKDSLVTNLRQICDLIPTLNITGDKALEATRQHIHATLYHTDPGLLRENPTIRSATAKKAQDILTSMSIFFPAEAGC